MCVLLFRFYAKRLDGDDNDGDDDDDGDDNDPLHQWRCIFSIRIHAAQLICTLAFNLCIYFYGHQRCFHFVVRRSTTRWHSEYGMSDAPNHSQQTANAAMRCAERMGGILSASHFDRHFQLKCVSLCVRLDFVLLCVRFRNLAFDSSALCSAGMRLIRVRCLCGAGVDVAAAAYQ